MLAKKKNQYSINILTLRFSWILVLVLWALTGAGQAQTDSKKLMPVLQEYKGVKIGMTAKEVQDKLGKAKSEDKEGLFYVFSDDETATIIVDAAQKVRAVSVMYGGDNPKPLKFEDVFGKSIQPEQQAGGMLYKL